MTAVITAPVEEMRIRRLIEFAAAIAELATERRDLDLRELIDDLHHDLMTFTIEED